MSQRAATIESLPMAFEVVKQMQADGLEWGEGYRPLGRRALAEIIEGRMAEAVDGWLEGLDGSAMRDRRNGSYPRRLLTELGDIELSVPRTRRYCPADLLRRYARRAPEIDRTILAGFVLGLSTRKVGEVLLSLLGRPVSPATVSRVARTLDAAVAAFHRRPLANAYKALMLDGVVLARKTGAGALRRPVLVALGIRPDGRKEIVDFRLAASESAAEWERFLTDLKERFARFDPNLHPDKTRLLEFGRNAQANRRQRGQGRRPETFDFLGFTHYCRKDRKGRFGPGRKPVAQRMTRTLRRIEEALRRRMHHSAGQTGKWLGRVIDGRLNDYAVPTSHRYLARFVHRLRRLWLGMLRRRSQKDRFSRDRLSRLVAVNWPRLEIRHPWPSQRLAVTSTRGRRRCSR